MVLTDPLLLKGGGKDALDVCRRAVQGGATAIQVRWKDGAPADVLRLTEALVAALPVPILVNDRADIALAARAAGAHLGQDDAPLAALRPHVPAGFILGISVGSEEEAARARSSSADYWSIGPCFATANKADAGAPLGPHGFAALARLAPDGVPVIGIGGITAQNAGQIIRAGAAGVAVIGAVLGPRDPQAAAGVLRASLAAALGEPA